MQATEHTQHRKVRLDAAAADEIGALPRLQRELLQLISAASTVPELLDELPGLLDRHADTLALSYFQTGADGELTASRHARSPQDDRRAQRYQRQMAAACQAACQSGELCVRRQTAPARTIIGAPIARQGKPPEAVGIVFDAQRRPAELVLLAQLAASHIVLWHLAAGSRACQADARDAAALVELLGQVNAASNLQHATYQLVAGLASHLSSQRVALGLKSSGKTRCSLAAVSGMAQFDNRSATAAAYEAAMDEASLCEQVTVWPASPGQPQPATLAYKKLASLQDAATVIGTPLQDTTGTAVGALIVFSEADPAAVDASRRFLSAAAQPLATSLGLARQVQGGRLSRLCRAAARAWQSWKAKAALSAALLSTAALLVPLPYRVHCPCLIEPVTRRFVAAPFDGTLEKALVEPGDIVRQGDVLARMDEREVRWRRAGIVADRNRALKQRDAAQAAHNYAEQQIAQLEIERWDLELQLLDHRRGNLVIQSPLDGIVVGGDLERVQGAPLTTGQTLFEIAPLESMISELAVPDDEISHLALGQTIALRLDAYPGQCWRATVNKVHPRAEIRDHDNVFIAEVGLDNSDGRLRPGMKGRATVVTQPRQLGWILFHKPWEYLTQRLSW